ncbi:MAG: hypothetical protein OXG97_19040 [Candidatus Poribacteria bacterium]|nr:hypothetical protein [Candidatus Poribacteria bacterium]
MTRERIIKDPPKRGKLTKSQVKRAVEKVVFGKHSDGETMSSGQYSKTRLRLGIPGIELQNPDMLQAFVEMGLLPPDVPLMNHSLELRLWVPWPANRTDFSLYKINPETGGTYGGASGLMMETRHTDSHFHPPLPDSVWENAPRVHWETFSEDIEDLIKIIIRTQHMRQRDWPLLPEGDSHWVDYFNKFLEYFEFQQQKFTMLNPQRVLIVCVGGFSSPIEELTRCLHKNLDRRSNITEITMVIEDCVDFEGEELGELIASSLTPIKLDVNIASLDVIAEILEHHRAAGKNPFLILPRKNKTYMLKGLRSTYIDYLAHLKSSNRELRADILSAIQRDCDARIERWDRFLHISVDFSFSEYDLERFSDMDRSLLDAIDSDEGIEEVISNAIKVLEEMLGWESRQKRSSHSGNPSQNATVKTGFLSSDLKEVAAQFMREYESFDNSNEARQFQTSVQALEEALNTQKSNQQIRILSKRCRVSFQDFVDAEKWKKPLEILEAFLQLDGAEEFIKKCSVPKVDGNVRSLQLEIEEFKTLVEILEEYNKLKAAGIDPGQPQWEQWEAKFKSLILRLLSDPQSQKIVQFLTDEFFEKIKDAF